MTPRPARLAAAALVVAGFLSLTPRASAEFIDGFDSGNPTGTYLILERSPNPYENNGTNVGAGVTRDIKVQVVSPLPPNFNSASGTVGGGLFSMSTDDNSAATATIRYTLTPAAGNLSGADSLDLRFLTLDGGNSSLTTPVSVSITTSTGTVTRTALVPDVALGSPATVSFNLGSFTGSDLATVSEITITLNGGTSGGGDAAKPPQIAADFSLDSVSVKPVPAPPALLLAGFGVLALVGRARWTRKPTATA